MITQEPTSAPERFLRLLRKAMASQRLSLRAVARQVDISPAYLSRLLNGDRGLPANETLSKLERVLDVQPPGILFDAAGRHDLVASSFLKKKSARPLMRSLAPLTDEDLERVLQLAEQLAQKHHGAAL